MIHWQSSGASCHCCLNSQTCSRVCHFSWGSQHDTLTLHPGASCPKCPLWPLLPQFINLFTSTPFQLGKLTCVTLALHSGASCPKRPLWPLLPQFTKLFTSTPPRLGKLTCDALALLSGDKYSLWPVSDLFMKLLMNTRQLRKSTCNTLALDSGAAELKYPLWPYLQSCTQIPDFSWGS